MDEPGRKAVVASIASGNDFLQSLPAEQMANLQGNNRQVDGQNFYVYDFNNKADGSNYIGFVQPETGILRRVDFVSNTEEGELKVVEKILTHTTTSTNLSNKTFRFSPPPGVKKVKSLSNDLLQLIQ
jgi:outer membrane lipoprotein-sorting protein